VACFFLCIPLSVNITLCVHSLLSWASLNYSPLRFLRRDSTLTRIGFVQKSTVEKWRVGFSLKYFGPAGPNIILCFRAKCLYVCSFVLPPERCTLRYCLKIVHLGPTYVGNR
jgi:hypothetical protein